MRRALPPVGWHSTAEHDPHSTTVCECENTVVMLKQPWHLTSMKNELGGLHEALQLVLARFELRGGFMRSTSWASTCEEGEAKEKTRQSGPTKRWRVLRALLGFPGARARNARGDAGARGFERDASTRARERRVECSRVARRPSKRARAPRGRADVRTRRHVAFPPRDVTALGAR